MSGWKIKGQLHLAGGERKKRRGERSRGICRSVAVPYVKGIFFGARSGERDDILRGQGF